MSGGEHHADIFVFESGLIQGVHDVFQSNVMRVHSVGGGGVEWHVSSPSLRTCANRTGVNVYDVVYGTPANGSAPDTPEVTLQQANLNSGESCRGGWGFTLFAHVVGKRVKVTGKLEMNSNTIRVESIEVVM